MAILATSDFTGKWAIPTPFNGGDTILQSYIDHYEPKYLNQLFGAALYVLYLADPVDPIYSVLTDPFEFDSEVITEGVGRVQISEGLKTMLKNFVYAHYQKEDLGIPTSGGNVNIIPEGGENMNDNRTNIFAYFNQGVKTYKAIQQFIVENRDDYPDYNGVELGSYGIRECKFLKWIYGTGCAEPRLSQVIKDEQNA